MCYDQLVLRYPPAELLVSARPCARGGGGGHLQLAIALVAQCLPDLSVLRLSSHRDDAVGIGFQIILESAREAATAGPLLAIAAGLDVSPEQLAPNKKSAGVFLL